MQAAQWTIATRLWLAAWLLLGWIPCALPGQESDFRDGEELAELSPPGMPDLSYGFDLQDLGYRDVALDLQRGDLRLRLLGVARGSLSTDRRIQFTGQETTFGAEGELFAEASAAHGEWLTGVAFESYLNLPFDRNILVDYPLRESFAHNFDIDTVEISQLFLTVQRGAWAIDLGKFVTPFGQYLGPQLSNDRREAPFIRSEAIGFRETGLQLRYRQGIWRHAVALVNGGEDRDTNSSKGLVARLGIDNDSLAWGGSVKWHDGEGSEGQKEFSNHAGLDFAWRRGRFTLAGECIYDQYGMRRPGLDLDSIFWGRSLYNRQLNGGLNEPLEGWGWYLNAIWRGSRGTSLIGYGQYHPAALGDSIHDQVNRRWLLRQTWLLTPRLEWFAAGFLEDRQENGFAGRPRDGLMILSGLQFHF